MLVDGEIERWVRLAATGLGLLAIGLPMLRVWRQRQMGRGRTTGSRRFLTRWPAVFLLSAIYLAVGLLLWRPIALAIPSQGRLLLTAAGALLFFPGIALYLWAFSTLGAMYGVSSTTAAELYEGHRLVESGPYALIRHPMYLGVLLVAAGALLIFRTWAMVVFAPSACVVILRARREERLLAQEFGQAWLQYRAQVPAWMPRLRRSKD